MPLLYETSNEKVYRNLIFKSRDARNGEEQALYKGINFNPVISANVIQQFQMGNEQVTEVKGADN